MHRLIYLPVAIVVLGGILLAVAALWPHLSDPQDYWTDAEARSRADAGSQYHGLAHRMSDAPPGEQGKALAQEFERARERYQQLGEAFSEAVDRYERPIRLLLRSGIACLVIGILGYFILRSAGGA
jgi:hypothetical protein